MNDQAAGLSIVSVLEPQTINGTTSGNAVDLRLYTGSIRVTQSTSMVDGPLVGTVQDSADGSTGWATVTGGTFAATSSIAFETLILKTRSLRRYIRWSTPSTPVDAITSVTMAAMPIRA